jgi:hypothetical protein
MPKRPCCAAFRSCLAIAIAICVACQWVDEAAIAGFSEPDKDPPAAEKKQLWAAISVSRPIFESGAAGDRFMIHFALVNDGDGAARPMLRSSQLVINGKELESWAFIIANGPRDDRWDELPAHDHLAFAYALGDVFDKPGIYEVVWKGQDFESAKIVFRALPRKG